MKRLLAFITICIMTAWQPNAAEDPFAPNYPFKTAIITYDVTDHRNVTTKMVQTIEGEKIREDDVAESPEGGSSLMLPDAEYYLNHKTKRFTDFHTKRAATYMRAAFNALAPAQQAQLIKNRKSLGANAPLTTYGFYKISSKTPHLTILGKETDCYEETHETGIPGAEMPQGLGLSVSTSCYWHGIELRRSSIRDGKETLTKQATGIVLDGELRAETFVLPKDYVANPDTNGTSQGEDGLSRDRYNRIVEKLAYKPSATIKDINFTAPLMGPL